MDNTDAENGLLLFNYIYYYYCISDNKEIKILFNVCFRERVITGEINFCRETSFVQL